MDMLVQEWVEHRGGLEQAVEHSALLPGLRARVRAACANREVAGGWQEFYIREFLEEDEEGSPPPEEEVHPGNAAEQQGFWGWLGSKLPF